METRRGPTRLRIDNSSESASRKFPSAARNSTYSLPLDVSWTPDLFGRIRNQVRAAQYTAQVDAADLELEILTEQADLAEFYFEIRGQDALIDLWTKTVAYYQKAPSSHRCPPVVHLRKASP
jgi:outer membrane protein TolC